jgi:SAM-dependent methyltransferase
MKSPEKGVSVKHPKPDSGIAQKVMSKLFRQRIPGFSSIRKYFAGKSGIEIGGPSKIFRYKGLLPLYPLVRKLDGCNFSNDTIWEGSLKNGAKYKFHPFKKGTQYVSDATDLSTLADGKYDFVISSNCLEHVANPLKAIAEWLRVIKMDGIILIVVPNKDFCFDHKRPVTQFTHLLADYQNEIQEDDLTHFDEIMALHDLSMDPKAGTIEQFKARSLKNHENRALHQHIFDIDLLQEIFRYFGLETIKTHSCKDHIILGKKKSA